MKTECNLCQAEFDVNGASIETVTKAGVSIQYFACPACGKKYVFYAADLPMQELTAHRTELERKIRMAHFKKFREKTIRGYLKELDRVKARQLELLPGLKRQAEQLLKETEESK